jgi:hypothetical protein
LLAAIGDIAASKRTLLEVGGIWKMFYSEWKNKSSQKCTTVRVFSLFTIIVYSDLSAMNNQLTER